MGAAARQRGDALIRRQTDEAVEALRKRGLVREWEAQLARRTIYCGRCGSRLYPADARSIVETTACSACRDKATARARAVSGPQP